MWTNEEINFWNDNAGLLVKLQTAHKQLNRAFPNYILSRQYLQIFYKTETGKDGKNLSYPVLVYFWANKFIEAYKSEIDVMEIAKRLNELKKEYNLFDAVIDTAESIYKYIPYVIGAVAFFMLINLVKD